MTHAVRLASAFSKIAAGAVLLWVLVNGLPVALGEVEPASSDPHIATILSDCEKAWAYRTHMTCRFRIAMEVGLDPGRPVEANPGTMATDGRFVTEGLFRRDGLRVDVIWPKPENSLAEAESEPLAQFRRDVIDAGHREWLRLRAGPKVELSWVERQPFPEGYTPEGFLANQMFSMFGGFGVIDGYVAADIPLPAILASADDVKGENEVAAGPYTGTIRVTGKYAGSQYTAWLDPAREFLPLGLQVTPLTGRGLLWEMRNVGFDRIGDQHLIASADVEVKALTGGFHVRGRIERSDCDLSPDFGAMGAFRLQAPPSFSVLNLEQPNLPHRLVDGRVIPAVDEEMIRSVEQMVEEAQKGGARSPGYTRSILTAGALAAVLAATAYAVMLHRRRRRGPVR